MQYIGMFALGSLVSLVAAASSASEKPSGDAGAPRGRISELDYRAHEAKYSSLATGFTAQRKCDQNNECVFDPVKQCRSWIQNNERMCMEQLPL